MDEDPLFIIVCLTVFAAPFSGVNVLLFLSVSDIMILLGLVVVAYRVLRGETFAFSNSVSLVLLTGSSLLIVQLLTIPRAAVPSAGLQWTRTQAGVLALFLLIVLAVDSRRDVFVLLRVITLSVVTIALLTIAHTVGIVQLGSGYMEPRMVLGYEIPFRRTLGVPMDYGNFGMYLSAGTGYLIFESVEFRNPWAAAGLPLVLLAALISQSRSSWAALAVVIAVFVFYGLYRLRAQLSFTSVTNALFAVAITSSIAGGIAAGNLLIQINPLTLQSRLHAIHESLGILQQAPFLGIGRYTYFNEFGQEIIHNGFINMLVAYGVVGFLLFLGVFVLTVIASVRSFSQPAVRFLGVALFAGFAGMIVELMLFDGSYTKILWIHLALIQSVIAAY